MKARLHIKGDKEPIELSFLEGKVAEEFINDTKILSDTPFCIENVWTGKKSDMRYVKFEREEIFKDRETLGEMSDPDFALMQEEMKQAKKEAVFEGFPLCSDDFWFQNKKVIRLEFLVNKKGEKYFNRLVTDARGFRGLQDTMDLYEKRMAKIEFAKKKELEHLTKVAEQQEIKK